MIVDQQNPTPKIHKKSPSPLKHHHRNKQHENENEIVSVENAENDFPNVIESKRSQTQSEVKKRRKVSPKDDFKIERVPQTQKPMKKRRSKSVIRETRNKPFLNVEMIFEDIKRPKKRHWNPRQKTQWKHFEIPKPPQIDNTLIIMNYNNDFSLHKLMKQVVKE
ncbi:hypothetical protein TRFO_23873 [Tritrichomonas foetus]|uniref:Uncharacterized protein n=1 Tax=Tritrichomonas foetus TaxID=1144522 RepID=A0A1J4K977_9EUKA|nr:hypothetical protein TRFO_23873 [Tritrichomonas foetus]|eukprot:OHT07771.1 hypothetical protein TRFO_23873 [Tritrichomonas foetus]